MHVSIFTDQMGEQIKLYAPPTRIISLVPSQTELLADLGLDQSVVGITKFCVHPSAWLASKAIVGGTKNFNFDLIDALKPDLVIGNKEENYKEGILRLKARYPVWMSDIISFSDALEMIQAVGTVTGCADKADAIAQRIVNAFSTLPNCNGKSVVYMIWRKPWMAAGTHTFIDNMIQKLGLRNSVQTARYPELSAEALYALNPDYIFLSSEPYPFQEKHIAELQHIVSSAKIILVDGEMFSWYGSRLIKAPAYFRQLMTA